MSPKFHVFRVLFSFLLIASVVLANASIVFADDGTPPEATATAEPTEEPADPTATEETELPLATETPTPEVTPTPDVNETASPEEQAPEEEAPEPALFEQIPGDTEVMVLNENGETLPLASEAAMDVILDTDPMWCPAGVQPGGSGCTINFATINALLPPLQNSVDLAAEDYIARQGANCQVALIGHFSFVSRLRQQVKKLWVLELNPREDDFPASAAPEIIPQADILAITATTLINHTFEGVVGLRKPGAKVLLLGPSTPLSPILFDYGISVLSGSVVENPEAVLHLVSQGASFNQIRSQGVRLVTVEAPGENRNHK